MSSPKRELSDEALRRLKAIAEGTYVPPPRDPFDLTADSLFAAVSGVRLPGPMWELQPGLRLVTTFAHVMVPATLAFARPERPRAPHPGPWMSLGGMGLDIEVEVQLDAEPGPLTALGFDRPNTIWFVVAMLRLRLGRPVLVPFLADRTIAKLQNDVETSNLLEVEMGTAYQLGGRPVVVDEDDLEWLRANIGSAARLMKVPAFNRAFQALDGAWHLGSHTSAVVVSWAAVETLIRPGRRNLTDRLCRALAAYLYAAGPDRDRAFTRIRASYDARGGGAHDSAHLKEDEFKTASEIARQAFMITIERSELPDVDQLLTQWGAGVRSSTP